MGILPAVLYAFTSCTIHSALKNAAILKAGVPFSSLLKEFGYRLVGRRPMSDLIPFILGEKKQQIWHEIDDKDVSVILMGPVCLARYGPLS